jgi:hypothetical protein
LKCGGARRTYDHLGSQSTPVRDSRLIAMRDTVIEKTQQSLTHVVAILALRCCGFTCKWTAYRGATIDVARRSDLRVQGERGLLDRIYLNNPVNPVQLARFFSLDVEFILNTEKSGDAARANISELRVALIRNNTLERCMSATDN